MTKRLGGITGLCPLPTLRLEKLPIVWVQKTGFLFIPDQSRTPLSGVKGLVRLTQLLEHNLIIIRYKPINKRITIGFIGILND